MTPAEELAAEIAVRIISSHANAWDDHDFARHDKEVARVAAIIREAIEARDAEWEEEIKYRECLDRMNRSIKGDPYPGD